jgi:hypothetical protein
MDRELAQQAMVRAVALTALTGLALAVAYWDAQENTGGVNIGLGLLVLFCHGLLAAGWACVDQRRWGTAHALVAWLVAAVLGAAAGLLLSRLVEAAEHGWSWTVFLSDLLLVAPLTATVTAAAAGFGVLVGGGTRVP